jgi:hypothetical protein
MAHIFPGLFLYARGTRQGHMTLLALRYCVNQENSSKCQQTSNNIMKKTTLFFLMYPVLVGGCVGRRIAMQLCNARYVSKAHTHSLSKYRNKATIYNDTKDF